MNHCDPYLNQLIRKEENAAKNRIRNRLQFLARKIMSDGYTLLSLKGDADPFEVIELIGEIKGYQKIRKELSFDVAQDGYTNELGAMLEKLKNTLPVKTPV